MLVASAEFTLKSSPVRRTLEQRLIDDLRVKLTRAGLEGVRIEKNAARLVVRGIQEPSRAARLCSRVFGVAYAAPALMLPASTQTVTQSIVNFARDGLQAGQSFAIRAHRSEPGPVSRRDIELKGGSEVLQTLKGRGVRVNLNQPDITFYVDLVGERAYVYTERFQGPGGLPLSSQWKMLAVLDSGPLTILAAYSMMRRGCLVELFVPISTNIPSFARDYQLNLVHKLREVVTRLSYRIFTIEFERLRRDGMVGQPLGLAASRQLVRMAATKVVKEKRFKGLILADISGKIGSATPQDLTEKQLPVFYPLIGLDRKDLAEMCRLMDLKEEELFAYTEAGFNGPESSDTPSDLRSMLGELSPQELSL